VTPPSGVIRLEVPALRRSLRLLRLAVADAATGLAFTLDEVECARIAVDELASVLLASGPAERLVLTIDRGGPELAVAGRLIGGSGSAASPIVDTVVTELLAVCVDEHHLDDSGPPSFDFRMRPSRRARGRAATPPG
jgi:hypothetical protein